MLVAQCVLLLAVLVVDGCRLSTSVFEIVRLLQLLRLFSGIGTARRPDIDCFCVVSTAFALLHKCLPVGCWCRLSSVVAVF